ncbi:hypothetical protein GS597_15995 [Synechococcales cyanobacterium C]|uniref:SAM-dependent chlorinase/fluorinase n=1 Tax=Petrachloros mirabilis ULC683 TaxID=2781853 RepID=A0A8K1ZZ30_9CYAN|nr:SAM-dependent chlorinase/fluorinase [Petrachloros mirabilis]NCJ07980.1 hypothetical protein [Petrachloros mirabilis ULC683]
MAAPVTLLTDFGQSDAYVGILKGVMLGICPSLEFVDLTHEIPAQNVALASFQLQNAFPYFPAQTVHLAVVDPGVGSERRGIAVQLPTGFLVGPDNGLFTGVLAAAASQNWPVQVVELNQPQYWRTAQPSATFHGRDIFAPVAAHLARGVPLTHLGSSLSEADLQGLTLPTWCPTRGQGAIQAIDHFGNLITNIPGQVACGTWSLVYDSGQIPGGRTYSDQPLGTLLGLVGSHGWVEIAVNGNSAQARLQANVGDRVRLVNWVDNGLSAANCGEFKPSH